MIKMAYVHVCISNAYNEVGIASISINACGKLTIV